MANMKGDDSERERLLSGGKYKVVVDMGTIIPEFIHVEPTVIYPGPRIRRPLHCGIG